VSGPAPAVAEIRSAVRHALESVSGDVLVACSGGADSLALAAAAAFVGPRLGRPVGLVTVDHGLQSGSADRAVKVAAWARSAGLAPVEIAEVTIDPADPAGPEAAARHARYEALYGYATGAVLLGHTLDDQAETVLLALARGAGPRGLSGMPFRRDVSGVALLRPLLGVRRATTRAACEALGLEPWEDPHNGDNRFARARVRASALPALVAALGDGVVGNLAQTAIQLAQDASYLDELAASALADCVDGDGLSVQGLAELPAALRTRALHAWALQIGAHAAALGHKHVKALDALVTAWHGQGATALPGGVLVARRDGRLVPTALSAPRPV
jgi:tRNA(Ile)-lysidine synthase